ncbi:hypothetical protein CL622_05455 [archaeon]|nr:hypothetical protein [archaeon]
MNKKLAQKLIQQFTKRYYVVPYWHTRTPKNINHYICNSDLYKKITNYDAVDICVRNIGVKLSDDGNKPKQLNIVKSKVTQEVINHSKNIISDVVGSLKENISDLAAINARLLTMLSMVNQNKFDTYWATYLAPGHFKDFSIPSGNLFLKFLLNIEGTDKAQSAFFNKLYTKTFAEGDEFVNKFIPATSGLPEMLGQLSFGLYMFTQDIYGPQQHKNALLKDKELMLSIKNAYELEKLILMAKPTYCYDKHDKIPEVFPPLFAIGFLYFTYPRYKEVTEVPISILDAHYFSEKKEEALIHMFNQLSSQEMAEYLTTGLYAINFNDKYCHQQAINAMHRFLLPIKNRLVNTNWAVLSNAVSKYNKILPSSLAKARLGAKKGRLQEDLNYRFQIYELAKKSKTDKQLSAFEKKKKFDKIYIGAGQYLEFCFRHGLQADEKLFKLIQEGKIGIEELTKKEG